MRACNSDTRKIANDGFSWSELYLNRVVLDRENSFLRKNQLYY